MCKLVCFIRGQGSPIRTVGNPKAKAEPMLYVGIKCPDIVDGLI